MEQAATFKRGLGLKESVTLTVGTVIGVGLFTVGANSVGYLGPVTLLATFTAFLASFYPALLYAEMGAALPYAGGTYRFAGKGLNGFWGMQAGWSFVISLIAVASGEALAFAFYFSTLINALGFDFAVDERVIAVAVVLLFVFINWRGIEITGRLQNGFMFFFWGVAIVWFMTMIPHISLEHFHVMPSGENLTFGSFVFITSLVWWCFAGFETCCAMGEEIHQPRINIPRALFLAPFIIFIVNVAFQWYLVGMVQPADLVALQEASAPYAEAMKQAGILGFPLVMLSAGIAFGGDFSTMNPAICAPARYLYSMAVDGVLPTALGKLHPKHKTPYVAIAFMGVITLLLIATGSIVYIASLSLFADLLYYVIGFGAFIGLRKRFPKMERPFVAPGGVAGAVASIVVYLVMMSQLPGDAFTTGFIWCVLGAVIYLVRKEKPGLDVKIVEEPAPTIEERQTLDNEFKRWRLIVLTLFCLALLLCFVPFIFG